MEYDIFDNITIALGLLAALLAAQCIILYVKAQTMRNHMKASLDELIQKERAKNDSKYAERESELKERGMRLESEYASLISEARKNARESDAKLKEAAAEKSEAHKLLSHTMAEEAHFKKLKEKCDALACEYEREMEKIAGISPQEAKELLQKSISKRLEDDTAAYRAQSFSKSAEELDFEARKILLNVIQRAALPQNSQINTCLVRLPNETMKGRLIGKEGRNIRSFEAATGTTLIIDETPDSVMISSFDPARREIAKIALERLLSDGRINPSSIESATVSAKSEIEKRALDAGNFAAEQLGVRKLSPEVAAQLGGLAFHLSLNQNTLEHSIESARIASLLAAELSCDTSLAKRAALLHDIGKTMKNDMPHARAGAEFLRRHGEPESVANAVEKHHEDLTDGDIYSAIVKIADSISSTRPGARMVPADGYFQRVKTLEDIAMSFAGVVSAYALQSGRELRIIVEPDTVDDALAKIIAAQVREKIVENIDTSIPVKITLIRETRVTDTASKSGDAETV